MSVEFAEAILRLRINREAVKADVAAGVDEGAAEASGRLRDPSGKFVKGAAAGGTTGGGKAGGTFRSAFQKEIDKGQPEFARAGSAGGASFGEKFGATAGKVTKGLAIAGVAAWVGIGVASVKMATDFQAAMLKVHTQAGATTQDVKTLSAQILALGGKVQQGPDELAAAMFHLKSVGLDNVDAMKALRAASDLAAVGGANLEDTTNAIAGAWRSGIKGAGDFGKAAATVNAIVGAGNVKMGDFIQAIGTGILPSARTFGVSLASVGSALALMTDEGIPAVVAATRLRMSLSLLGAPSAVAEKQLGTIGLTGLKLANAMRGPQGLIGAIGLLKSHLDASKLSLSEQAQLLSHAFGGGRSSSGILTLLNNYDVLVRKQDQINHSLGKFGPAVAAQRKTASAQFALLRSSVDSIAIEIGQKLLPVVTAFVGWLSRTHVVVPLAVAALGLLTTAMIVFGVATIAAEPELYAIALGIAALVAAAAFVATHWGSIWGGITRVAVGAWHLILGAADAVWSFIKSHYVLILAIVAGPFGLAAGLIIKYWHQISAGGAAVLAFLRPVFHAIGVAAYVAFQVIQVAAKIAWDIVSGVLLLEWAIIRPVLHALGALGAWVFTHVIVPAAKAGWHDVTAFLRFEWGIIRPILQLLGSVAVGIWHAIGHASSILWAGVKQDVTAAVNVGKSVIRALWGVISSVFGFIINGAAKAFGWVPGLGPKLQTAARQFNTFRNNVSAALNGINGRSVKVEVGFAANAPGGTNNPIGSLGKALGGRISGPGTSTSDNIPAMLSDGEWVMPAASVQHYGAGFMSLVQARRFAVGGPAQRFAGGGLAVTARTSSKARIDADVVRAVTKLANSQALALLGGISGGPIGGGSYGVARWAPLILEALAMLGQSSVWLSTVERRMNQESGGNPYAINLTDSNAAAGDPSRGLMQTIMSTFQAYRSWALPDNIYNPLANIFAGLNYALHRYGSLAALNQPGGYAAGGPVRRLASGGTINEHVLGIGASGTRYELGEAGVEHVINGADMATLCRLLERIDKKMAQLIDATKGAPVAFAAGLNGGARAAAHAGR